MKLRSLPPPRPGTTVAIFDRSTKVGRRWGVDYFTEPDRRVRAMIGSKREAETAAARLRLESYETKALGRSTTRPALTLGALAKLQLERGARKKSARHDAARWPAILAFLGEGRDVSTISSSDVTALRTHLLSLPGRAPRGTRSTTASGDTHGTESAPVDCPTSPRTEASHGAGTPEEPGKKSPRKMSGRSHGPAKVSDTPPSGASPATANRHLALLRSAMQIAIEEKAITENPVRRGHMLPERARDRIATPDELSRLLAVAKPTLRMAITLACETVLRRGSLAEITWERLDLESRTLTLPDSKSGDPIRVPLSRRATAALEAWPRTSARVIDVHPDTVSHQFAALCRALSIPDLTFHDLRHTAATRLMDSGLDWTQVMRLGGWRSVQAFARYRSIRVDTLRVALDRVT